jgi:glutaredoxin
MKVEIYTKEACTYCVQAKKLFESKGMEYTEYYIDINTREKLVEELTLRLGVQPRTVPQIFIDGQAIGGYTELVTWMKNQ